MEPQKDEQQQPEVDSNIQTQPTNEFAPKQIDINSDDGMIINSSNDTDQPVSAQTNSEEASPTDQTTSASTQQDLTQNTSETTVNSEALASNEEKPKTEEEKTDNPLAVPSQPKPKSKVPKIAIFLAILAALTLAGVAAYIFIGGQKDDSSSNNSVNTVTEQQQNQTQPITSDEIDQTVNQIDQDLNKTTNDEDLPTSESVSDQSLNLQ